jgi:DNA-binding NtrC family response regulator
MERAVLLAEGETITSEDLNLFFARETADGSEESIKLPAGGVRLEDAERDLIVQALERCSWVQKDAAELLGVSSRALNYKIKRFGITHSGWKQNK